MEWTMFIIFFVTNLLICLIFRVTYSSFGKYDKGMVLAVHIPKEYAEDADVQAIAAKAVKVNKIFQNSNLIVGLGICFINLWSILIFIIAYLVWLAVFCGGIEYLNISLHKKMYALKIENGWGLDENGNSLDDDECWKTGFYYNPDDKRIFVPNRMQSGNYALNYATKRAKIYTSALAVIVIGSVIYVVVMLVPFINPHVEIEVSGDTLKVDAAGYDTEIKISDIKEIEKFDELPDYGFSKSNGGYTDEYMIGRFNSYDYGKCDMYVLTDYSPILMIKTDDNLLFFNSEDETEIDKIYEELSDLP